MLRRQLSIQTGLATDAPALSSFLHRVCLISEHVGLHETSVLECEDPVDGGD